ncbi:recombinase family protein [Blautia wexlerae]|uniref:recombinase family protein n=1 Tax=Blautia wexlerae TaxID=418240 RepID=UPI001D06699C|nr:recombinase family protein [Blautia wexlerae]MCB6686819.1 recombinase family protein [Blautia wexlerae]
MAKGHRKTPEEKAAVAKQKRKQRRAKRKKEARDNLTKEEILQDDRFFCIAGYTSGGAPYQVQFQRFDTIKKKHWSPTTVAAIVRDEIYIGTRIWGKTRCSMHNLENTSTKRRG